MEEDPCNSSSCSTVSASSLELTTPSSSSLSSSSSSTSSSLSTQMIITPPAADIIKETSPAQVSAATSHGYGGSRSTHRVLSRLRSSRGASFFFPPSRPHLYDHRLVKTLRSVINSLLCNSTQMNDIIYSETVPDNITKTEHEKIQLSESSSRLSDTETSLTDVNICSSEQHCRISARRRPKCRTPSSSIDSLISLLSSSSISVCSTSSSSTRASSAMKARHVVTGTLYGQRAGRMRFAVQDFSDAESSKSTPLLLLLQLASSTNSLIKEMAAGPVRIALECRVSSNSVLSEQNLNPNSLIRQRLSISASSSPAITSASRNNYCRQEFINNVNNNGIKGDIYYNQRVLHLLDERCWTMYCNGKRLGFAQRRACTESDIHILSLMQAVSMGAGILPISQVTHIANRTSNSNSNSSVIKPRDGEILYMRSQFERVIGSSDSEAFYMMNPAGHGGPELSLFLLRINDNTA